MHTPQKRDLARKNSHFSSKLSRFKIIPSNLKNTNNLHTHLSIVKLKAGESACIPYLDTDITICVYLTWDVLHFNPEFDTTPVIGTQNLQGSVLAVRLGLEESHYICRIF